MFNPQLVSVPSLHNAKLCAPPVATVDTFLLLRTPERVTAKGILLEVSLLFPRLPDALAPHATVVSSLQSATLCAADAETAITLLVNSAPVFIVTGTGTKLVLLLEFPSWPELFSHQAATVPSEHTARL